MVKIQTLTQLSTALLLLFSSAANAQNVGIGQATPVSKLHVEASTTAGDGVQITSTTTSSTATDGVKIGLSGSDALINQQENAALNLHTNKIERVSIEANGNAAINNTANASTDAFAVYAGNWATFTGSLGTGTRTNASVGNYPVNAYAKTRTAIFAENDAQGSGTAITPTGWFYNHGAAATTGNSPTSTLFTKLGATNASIDASPYGISSAAMYIQNDYTNTDMAAWITNVGSGVNGSAMQANNYSTTAGTNFFGGARVSVAGQTPGGSANTGNVFCFGVYGAAGLYGNKTAGTIGISTFGAGSTSITGGGLGYWAGSGTEYGVYGFSKAYFTGSTSGRYHKPKSGNTTSAVPVSSQVGMGINGTVMGGWLQGKIYGTYMRGERFSTYIDGAAMTNQPITQLVEVDNQQARVATYASVSQTADITARGKARLVNGRAVVTLDANFRNLVGDDIIVTATPIGDCNGVHLVSMKNDNFVVAENQKGTSNVEFTWIAVGSIKKYQNNTVSPEILDKNFDTNMRGVTHDDNDATAPTPIWYDGNEVRFDAIPAGTIDRTAPEGMMGKEPIKQITRTKDDK